MDKPTEKQWQKLWERCGFKEYKYRTTGFIMDVTEWDYPNGKRYKNLPDLDLNSLSRYAVPVLQSKGFQIDIVCLEEKGFNVCAWDVLHDDGKEAVCENDDLATALFSVCNEILEALDK